MRTLSTSTILHTISVDRSHGALSAHRGIGRPRSKHLLIIPRNDYSHRKSVFEAIERWRTPRKKQERPHAKRSSRFSIHGTMDLTRLFCFVPSCVYTIYELTVDVDRVCTYSPTCSCSGVGSSLPRICFFLRCVIPSSKLMWSFP